MTISKQWLTEEIEHWEKKKLDGIHENTLIQSERIDGIIQGLKIAYEQLIQPAIKKEKIPFDIETFDTEKLYEKMLNYYILEKGYSKDDANRIAMIIVEQQKEKHGMR